MLQRVIYNTIPRIRVFDKFRHKLFQKTIDKQLIINKYSKLKCNTPNIFPQDINFEETLTLIQKKLANHKEWKIIHNSILLKHNCTNEDYNHFCNRILNLGFFPKSVMLVSHNSSYISPVVGDNFIQRVPLIPYLHPGIFDVLTCDKVLEVKQDKNTCYITVGTTDQHDEVGIHKTWVRRQQETNDLWFEYISISYFQPSVPFFMQWYARLLQMYCYNVTIKSLKL